MDANSNRKWVADRNTGELSTYFAPYTEMPEDAFIVPEPDHGWDKWDFNTSSFIRYIDPLEQLKALFLGLPLEVRKAFSTDRTNVLAAITEGDFELALYITEGLQVPEELQPIKSNMIQLIQAMSGNV